MLAAPQPVLVSELFPEVHDALIALLKSLSTEDWQKPTVCTGWSVKEVALHLLGGEIGNLSRRRDGWAVDAAIHNPRQLVAFVNEWNQSWVSAAGRMSTPVLINLLETVGAQMCTYFQSLDPFAQGGAVSWAGPQPAPLWLDLAREYTERWHHQQHIRDAVGKPGLKDRRYFAPVLAAFVRALPVTYARVSAPEDTCVTLTISGPSGGQWSIRRKWMEWQLFDGAPSQPAAEVTLPQETAWRLFTRGISPNTAQEQMILQGNATLGSKVLDMVSIIA